MAYLHNEPNVIVHRDLKPRFVSLFTATFIILQSLLSSLMCEIGNFDPFTNEWVDLVVIYLDTLNGLYKRKQKMKKQVNWLETRPKFIVPIWPVFTRTKLLVSVYLFL